LADLSSVGQSTVDELPDANPAILLSRTSRWIIGECKRLKSSNGVSSLIVGWSLESSAGIKAALKKNTSTGLLNGITHFHTGAKVAAFN